HRFPREDDRGPARIDRLIDPANAISVAIERVLGDSDFSAPLISDARRNKYPAQYRIESPARFDRAWHLFGTPDMSLAQNDFGCKDCHDDRNCDAGQGAGMSRRETCDRTAKQQHHDCERRYRKPNQPIDTDIAVPRDEESQQEVSIRPVLIGSEGASERGTGDAY